MVNKLACEIKGLLKTRDSVVCGADAIRENEVNTTVESNSIRDIENEIFIKKLRELLNEY